MREDEWKEEQKKNNKKLLCRTAVVLRAHDEHLMVWLIDIQSFVCLLTPCCDTRSECCNAQKQSPLSYCITGPGGTIAPLSSTVRVKERTFFHFSL